MKDEDIEIQLLLEAIYLKYGYDYRTFSQSSIKRCIKQRVIKSRLSNITELQKKVIQDKIFFETTLFYFTRNITKIYRDSSFYQVLKNNHSQLENISIFEDIACWLSNKVMKYTQWQFY